LAKRVFAGLRNLRHRAHFLIVPDNEEQPGAPTTGKKKGTKL